jgi:hypothetical protein
LRRVGELVVRNGRRIGRGRRVVVVATVIYRVVPCGGADARADVLVSEVKLGEKIETVGNQTAIEVAVAVVGIGAGAQCLGALVHAPGGAVFDRVVPAEFQLRLASLELERARGRQEQESGRRPCDDRDRT